MANVSYIDSYKIIPIFAIAGVFNLLYLLVSLYSFHNKRTGLISIITTICCAINILLNYMLIPIYGINGAAFSALLTSILLFYFNYLAASLNSEIILMKAIYIDIILLIFFTLIANLIDNKNTYLDLFLRITLLIGILMAYIKTSKIKSITL
jgi:O-antigen/teichoic acid export membrane protein